LDEGGQGWTIATAKLLDKISDAVAGDAMSVNKIEAKQLLERMIFEDTAPKDWVQDVWDLSPLLGDSAAKLFEAFELLIDCCPEERLDNLVKSLYREKLES